MGDDVTEMRVNCRQCRFSFPVQVSPSEDWRVEAQCPSCDGWACYTIADTRDPPRPDLRELETEVQRLGERLWQLINEHRNHPAVAWMDHVGNGMFEDDHSDISWPIPWHVYRFTRRAKAAYIWQEVGSWFVRGWHSTRSRRKPPEPAEVFSFEAALDRLLE
jgi:hypothetical protein